MQLIIGVTRQFWLAEQEPDKISPSPPLQYPFLSVNKIWTLGLRGGPGEEQHRVCSPGSYLECISNKKWVKPVVSGTNMPDSEFSFCFSKAKWTQTNNFNFHCLCFLIYKIGKKKKSCPKDCSDSDNYSNSCYLLSYHYVPGTVLSTWRILTH